MKTLAASLLFLFLGQLTAFAQQTHVILCGGPALRSWEDLRVSPDQHDRWWANFVRASTMRMDEIKKAYGDNANIVWFVYKPGYVTRGREDGIRDQPRSRGLGDVYKRQVRLRLVQDYLRIDVANIPIRCVESVSYTHLTLPTNREV